MSICISIPTVNGPQRLERCLHSIFSTEDKAKSFTRIFVLDDCSEPLLLEANKEICARFGVELLMHSQRMGVSKSWNDLTNHTDSEYIILLNDDVEVSKHWLSAMYYTLANNEFLGVVGYNAYEGPNRYNVLPIVPSYIESHLMFGSSKAPLLSAKGYAFGFRKSDYLAIGGFDENYFCFFEEVDFNLSMMKLNKRNAILSYPILFHGVGETTTSVLSDPQLVFNQSKTYFETKWEIKWEDLRTKFSDRIVPWYQLPALNEWNTNIYVWN